MQTATGLLEIFLQIVFIGIGATLLMDFWAWLRLKLFKVTSLSYAVVGRWLLYMPKGYFHHNNLMGMPKLRHEKSIGWVAHYMTGVVFAAIFIVFVGERWLSAPTLKAALIMGVATLMFPFFVMHPAFGLGLAATKTKAPLQAQLRSLMTHGIFGLGLYVSAYCILQLPI